MLQQDWLLLAQFVSPQGHGMDRRINFHRAAWNYLLLFKLIISYVIM